MTTLLGDEVLLELYNVECPGLPGDLFFYKISFSYTMLRSLMTSQAIQHQAQQIACFTERFLS